MQWSATRSSRTLRYLNRELSWLDFNARVLALAEDPALPLLERAKFLAIFSAEPRRVLPGARLRRSRSSSTAGLRTTSPDGLDQVEQLHAIRAAGRRARRRGRQPCSRRRSRPRSRRPASAFSTGTISTPTTAPSSRRVFDERIFPVLTPLAVDPAHPFPYISNLSLNLAVVVRDPHSARSGSRA